LHLPQPWNYVVSNFTRQWTVLRPLPPGLHRPGRCEVKMQKLTMRRSASPDVGAQLAAPFRFRVAHEPPFGVRRLDAALACRGLTQRYTSMILAPIFRWGIWCGHNSSSVSFSDGDSGRRGGGSPSEFPRMNSGVRIIRAIYITALKRGDREHVLFFASRRLISKRISIRGWCQATTNESGVKPPHSKVRRSANLQRTTLNLEPILERRPR